MWTKRKHGSHLQASNRSSPYDDSWEELGFADDAAGPLGGCIWPPRSYSCSFCTREFRSAQALGGHMNVHRRDRARLKQSPPLPHSELFHHQQQHHDHQNHNNLFRTPYSPLGFQYPSHQICNLIYSPKPNSDPAIVASPSSPSKASITPPARGNCDEKIFFPFFSSSTKKDKQVSPRSSPSSWPNISDPTSEREKKSRILESGCRAKVDYFKNDLSVSLNFVVKRACPTISDGDDDDDEEEEEEEENEEEKVEEEAIGCKRRRTSTSTLPIFIKTNNSVDRHHAQSEVYEIGPCSLEELDLELRLGDRPKVK